MARSSTPLTCLTFYGLLLCVFAGDQHDCEGSAAANCDDNPSWVIAESEQAEGLELLQFMSKKVNAVNEWQCHTYTEGQGDEWCALAGIQGGFEYSFNSGKSSQCGNCWCCKRSTEPASSTMIEEKPAPLMTAKSSQWTCHDYLDGQSNDWCIDMASKTTTDFEFAYTGGKVDLCGDCWCCKRSSAGVETVIAQEQPVVNPVVKPVEPTDNWQCHQYFGGQDDAWCQSVGIHEGFEYSFNGGKDSPCDDCWCCKREARSPELPHTVQGLPVHQEASGKLIENEAPWACHVYSDGENDNWCKGQTQSEVEGYEFLFTEGKQDLCGDCWCCKRSKNAQPPGLAQIASGHTEKVEKAIDSELAQEKAEPWQCHQYSTEQNDEWCATAGVQGDVEYSFNNGTSSQCGDCWCCKRSFTQEREPKKLEQAPKWQCHLYEKDQDNDWCVGMASKAIGDYEFAYTGGQVDLCGDCWCCKRETAFRSEIQDKKDEDKNEKAEEKATVEEEKTEDKANVEKEKAVAEEENAKAEETKSGSWSCHSYTAEQNDEWCQTAGTQGGFEYTFTGGEVDQCGDCWCCKREVNKEVPTSKLLEAEMPAEEPWQCHDYVDGQSDDWCMTTKHFGEYEYAFTSGRVDLCGDCWCCKRKQGMIMHD